MDILVIFDEATSTVGVGNKCYLVELVVSD